MAAGRVTLALLGVHQCARQKACLTLLLEPLTATTYSAAMSDTVDNTTERIKAIRRQERTDRDKHIAAEIEQARRIADALAHRTETTEPQRRSTSTAGA